MTQDKKLVEKGAGSQVIASRATTLGGKSLFRAIKLSGDEGNQFPNGIFPENICGAHAKPTSKTEEDDKSKDSALIIAHTVDEIVAYANAKLESLRGSISNEQYRALKQALEGYKKALDGLKATNYVLPSPVCTIPQSSSAQPAGSQSPLIIVISQLHPTCVLHHNSRNVTVGILKASDDKVSFWDARLLVDEYNAQYGTAAKLISHQLADAMLNDDAGAWRFFEDNECYTFLTNAFLAYEAPNKKLGKEIVYDNSSYRDNPRVIVQTGRYAGSKGIALFIPDVTFKDLKRSGNDIILDVPDSRIIVVDNFPSDNGWYSPDPVTLIPQGMGVKSSPSARYLRRLDGNYVGPVVRSCYSDFNKQGVNVDYGPFNCHGVAVEYALG